jgi:hypothetical protein
MAIPEVLTRAVAAARAGDAETVRRLIDWPMTGAAVMLNVLDAVDEWDRATSSARGFAELDGAAGDAEMVGNILATQAEFLVPADDIQVADETERAEVVAALQVLPVPPGLTPEQMARVDQLRARAALIHDVYIVVAPAGRQPYAIAPDTGLLVLLLD